MWFKNIKDSWLGFIQVGIWLVTVLGTFVISPPLLSAGGSSKMQGLTHFLVAGVTALVFIPLKRRSQKTDHSFWQRIAIFSFVSCCVLVFIYSWQYQQNTVHFYDEVLVKGQTMKLEALKQKEAVAKQLGLPEIDEETFVKARQGKTQYIWPQQELESRYYLLLLFYLLSAITLLLFILSVTQSIFCYDNTPATGI